MLENSFYGERMRNEKVKNIPKSTQQLAHVTVASVYY